MNKTHLLWLGSGDIAARSLSTLAQMGIEVTGLSRSDRRLPEHSDYICGAVNEAATLAKIATVATDILVISMSPDGRREEDYYRAYIESIRSLRRVWKNSVKQPYVIYISSTSVYGQSSGEAVDENSETLPSRETAKILLQAEKELLSAAIPCSIVRFSGIYGPGRDYLVRQVKEGKGGNNSMTNRIHVDDCVGVICHLVERFQNQQDNPRFLLASDCEPVSSKGVREWLASELALPAPTNVANTSQLGKRCSNKRLLALGYSFKYPSYREGYRAMFKENGKGTSL